MTDHTDAHAADLSALRRNYTFDRARDAIATAVAQLADARATLILAERLHDHLGVMDHRLLTHSILTLDDDLHTLQEALAATTAALARFRGLPQPARIRCRSTPRPMRPRSESTSTTPASTTSPPRPRPRLRTPPTTGLPRPG